MFDANSAAAAWCRAVRRAFSAVLWAAAFLLTPITALADPAELRQIGVSAIDATPELAAEQGLIVSHGALVTSIAPGSPASQVDLAPGDLVISAGGGAINTVDALGAAIAAKGAGETIALVRLRQLDAASVEITIPAASDALASDRRRTPIGDPLLMLDTGGHQALVKGLAFFDEGRRVVSAGDDKTIRIWNVETGQPERVIRGPAMLGGGGQIYALALSPDEKILAVAGFLANNIEDGATIRLLDLATGRILNILRGHTDAIGALAFSPDGRQLVSGSYDWTARTWDVATGAPVHVLSGHSDFVLGVAFSPDNRRVVTSADDMTVRLWNAADGREMRVMTGHQQKIFAMAMAPDGTIASGDDGGEIRLWDSRDGSFIRTLARQGRSVGALVFSPDSKRLVSATSEFGSGPFAQRIWDVETGVELVRVDDHQNTVVSAAWAPNNLVATGGGLNSEVNVWDAETGEIKARLQGLGQRVWSTAFSPDGTQLGWGVGYHSSPALATNPIETVMPLPLGENAAPTEPRPADANDVWARSILEGHGMRLTHSAGGAYGYSSAILEIWRGGELGLSIPRSSSEGYRHLAYTLSPDGAFLVSAGNSGILTAYDLQGFEIGRYVGHTGDIWSVTPSPDGRYLASSSDDQTVRLWNMRTRELIVTIFHGDDGSWVMWTPQGYYTASLNPRASQRIGWLLNYGPNETPDFITAEQLGPTLFRPRLVARAIQLASAREAIDEFNRAYAEGRSPTGRVEREPLPTNLQELFQTLPPALRIVAVDELPTGEAVATVALRLQGRGLEAIEATVNERAVRARPDFGPIDETIYDRVEIAPDEVLRRFRIPLTQGGNVLSMTARTDAGRSTADQVSLAYGSEGQLDRDGRLRILAIGIDRYGEAWGFEDLEFAAADAMAFAETAERVMGPQHPLGVEVRLLVTGGEVEPTAAAIREGLDWLAQSGDTDTSILFLAGHGVSEQDDYYLLPTDFRRSPGETGANALPWSEFRERLEDAKGRKILFLDACRSDYAFNATLSVDAQRADTIAFSSTSEGQEAIEDAAVGHGLFTYALLESLDGRAFDDRGELWSSDLGVNVERLVRRLSSGKQIPFYTSELGSVLLAEK